MTIQEALRSGLRFQRPYWGKNFIEPDATGKAILKLSFEDMLATDWQVERHDTSTEKLVEEIIQHRRQIVAHLDEMLEKLGYKK